MPSTTATRRKSEIEDDSGYSDEEFDYSDDESGYSKKKSNPDGGAKSGEDSRRRDAGAGPGGDRQRAAPALDGVSRPLLPHSNSG